MPRRSDTAHTTASTRPSSYHFPTSPFARRVRLALLHKGLSAELRDVRANPDHQTELRRINPLHTVPVLVDGERIVADSTAILHYVDRKIPGPPLWPEGAAGAEAFELMTLADAVIAILADLGTRYHAFHDHPSFPEVRGQFIGRAQGALDRLAERVKGHPEGRALCGDAWSAADIALYTTVAWLEGLPARAKTQPAPARVMSLGWTLPSALSAWADPHRHRPDVIALG
jgi:glutathione S-transferase